jgi:hypothetical protein
MSGFTLFRRGECPVCNGAARGCRESNSTGLVFCRNISANPPNYLYRGEDSWGFGLWQLSSDADAFSEQAREERQRRRQEFLAAEERRRQEQISRQLPAVERHKWYSKLLERLTLASDDQQKLLSRGFTQEQIVIDGYKSVSSWQKVGKDFPANLPGLLPSNALNIAENGIVCPIRNENGLIIGCQVRLHESTDGRYRWLSSATKKNPDGPTPHLNGELPLGVFEPEQFAGDSIWLTEGTAIKPSLTRYRLGVPVVGAASGRFNGSPEAAAAAVDYLTTKYQTKTLTFAVDAGDVLNFSGVPERWKQQFEFFTTRGYECRVAWWAQVHKDSPDIDELPPEQFDNIRYLSVAEFKALCIKWGGLEKEKTSDVLPISYEERVAAAQKKLHTLSYPADIVCDPTKKYLPNLVDLIPKKGMVGIVARKGSGKSYQINEIKKHCCGYWEDKIIHPVAPELPPEQLELFRKKKMTPGEEKALEPRTERVFQKGLGMKFLSINARIALGRGQAIQWNFTWIEDADADGLEEFGGAKLRTTTILEEMGEIGLCWDSLGKIFGRDWSNTLVVIDEIELGLNHVATSSTCRDRRSFILHTLEHKLKECLDGGGLVIAADADLTDSSLDYLTAIAPGYPPFIVDHQFKGDPWEIDFYTGERDVVLSEIEDLLSDPDCKPIVIAVDNQKEAESLAAHLIKEYPRLANKENGGVIRIDSRTTQTDFGSEFVERTNEGIKKYQPKVLLYTPSLGVGCSIDVKYFAHVYGLFFGNIEPSQARQMLARVRESVPRTVWAKTRAGKTEGDDPTSCLPEEIKRRMFDYHNGGMILMQTALTKARDMAKADGVVDPEDKDINPRLIEVLQGMMGADGSWNNPHLDLYCNQIARRNFALNQYAVQLRQELIEEGHCVKDWVEDAKTKAGDKTRSGREEINRTDAVMTANAPDINLEEAKEIKRKPNRTSEEEYAASKALLKEELPGVELTPGFLYKAIHKDNRRWLNQAKLYWHIFNLDALKDKDEREWRYRLKQFKDGVVFLPDIKTDTPKVEAILKSGVLDWINPNDLETEYSNESEGGQEFVEKCHKNRKLIKTALGITVKNDSEPIKLANRILDRIGLALTCSGQVREEQKRTRYYKVDKELAADTDRQAVWDALNSRWQERLSKIAEVNSQYASRLSQIEENLLYKNQASVTPNQPSERTENNVVFRVTDTPGFTAETLAEVLSTVDAREEYEDLLACNDKSLIDVAWGLLTQEVRDRINGFYEPQVIDNVGTSHPQVADVPPELTLIDDQIKASSLLSDLEQIPPVELWTRRLNRALLMAGESARLVYAMLPQQILHEVWGRLTYGVQSQYADLFAA